MATVIIGGGIIGLSTAFYLSQGPSHTNPRDIHLVESSPELFASASGNSGGFLAADWVGGAQGPLAKLSFDLHKQLADEHGGEKRWGYCRSTGTSWTDANSKGKRGDDWLRQGGSRSDLVAEHAVKKGTGPTWLQQRTGGKLEIISEDTETAQVDPLRLCQFLLQACRERGVHLHQPAKAESVIRDAHGKIDAVMIRSVRSSKTTKVACKKLVLTAGAWSNQVFKDLFPAASLSLPITSLSGHSIILRSPRWKAGDENAVTGGGCHAVFATDTGYCPEMFSRLGGEIFLGGKNDAAIPLPETALDGNIDPKVIEEMKMTACKLLGQVSDGPELDMGDLEVVREGLCFRPVTNHGAPIVSRIYENQLGSGFKSNEGSGVWFSAGHGPWGISQSLGTGKVLSELVEGRPTSCDVSGLCLDKVPRERESKL